MGIFFCESTTTLCIFNRPIRKLIKISLVLDLLSITFMLLDKYIIDFFSFAKNWQLEKKLNDLKIVRCTF